MTINCAHSAIWPLDKFNPHPRNPNRHPKDQIALLADILKAQGWRSPICVSTRSGYVIKGHGRLEAARLAGFDEAPVDLQAYASEELELADLIADNRIAELSDREPDAITSLLRDLQSMPAVDLKITGYDAKAVTKLLAEPAPDDGDGQPEMDRAQALQAKYGTADGQLWALGPHRILCGDCTLSANWKRLMGKEPAHLNFTDPPYGVDYKNASGTGIQNDKLQRDALAKLVRLALAQAVKHTTPDAAFYIWHAMAPRRDFEHALDTAGLIEKQYITWVKDSFTLGHADYHWQTEPCFYAEKAGQAAKWYGDRTQGTVWRLTSVAPASEPIALANGVLLSDGADAQLFLRADKPRQGKVRHLRVLPGQPVLIADRATSTAWEVARDPRAEYLHPTQKPAGLARIAILNSTPPGGIVVDQFSGSASTLVAAERTGRRARAMDLEPKFVAVALERWSKISGKEPELITQ